MIKPISNIEVFGLESSIVASGYSFRTSNSHFKNDVEILQKEMSNEEDFLKVWYDVKENNTPISDPDLSLAIKHFKRAVNLGNTKAGSGHDQYLTGIVVNMDVTFSNKVWTEAERYSHFSYITSSSTIHCMTKFDIDDRSMYESGVDPRVVDIMREKLTEYRRLKNYREQFNKDSKEYKSISDTMQNLYVELVMTNPAGFNIFARMTTNYRQLKTIYSQRYNHPMVEWRSFCEQLRDLPYFCQLVLGE